METILIHKKSDEWNPDSMTISPTTSLRRNTVTPTHNKRVLNRKHSFTRGTASSLAKAVRPETKINEGLNRKKSVKTRKQSMTTSIENKAVFMATPLLLQQRRSSWSPHTPFLPAEKKSSVVVLDQVPSPLLKRVTTPSRLIPSEERHMPRQPITVAEYPSPQLERLSPTHNDRTIPNAPSKIFNQQLNGSSSETISRKKRSDDDLKASVQNRRRSLMHFSKYTVNKTVHPIDTVDETPMDTPLDTPPDDISPPALHINTANDLKYPETEEPPRPTTEHTHDLEDDSHLPGYMRRPICAACDRNVKVMTSSDNLAKKAISTSTSNSSSRRSSLSRMSPTSTSSRRLRRNNLSVTISPELEEIVLTPTTTLSFSMTSDEEEQMLVLSPRSLSPVSPIPTAYDNSTGDNIDNNTGDNIDNNIDNTAPSVIIKEEAVIRRTPTVMNYSHYSTPDLIQSIQKDISESKERILDSLRKEKVADFEDILTTQLQLMSKLECLIQPTPVPTEDIKVTSWQTKLEYSVARMRYGMSQWMGTVVGTGEIEEQDFDMRGYTKNVVISGVCVTTEPALLPKSLQKYYNEEQLICHKYVIQLSPQTRLSNFQLKDKHSWIPDDTVRQCEFTCSVSNGPVMKTKRCSTEFGVFERKHHCRSCGHIFCHQHSLNQLPLFVSNGEDRGEWSRVCDTCFYSRMNSHLSKT